MTPDARKKLRELAMAAHHGHPWFQSERRRTAICREGDRERIRIGEICDADDAAYIAAVHPGAIIELLDAVEEAERVAARRDRQATTSRDFWVRAAKAALKGDTRELANRVALAEAPLDIEVTLS